MSVCPVAKEIGSAWLGMIAMRRKAGINRRAMEVMELGLKRRLMNDSPLENSCRWQGTKGALLGRPGEVIAAIDPFLLDIGGNRYDMAISVKVIRASLGVIRNRPARVKPIRSDIQGHFVPASKPPA